MDSWRVAKVLAVTVYVVAALFVVGTVVAALIPGGNWHADQNPSYSTD